MKSKAAKNNESCERYLKLSWGILSVGFQGLHEQKEQATLLLAELYSKRKITLKSFECHVLELRGLTKS